MLRLFSLRRIIRAIERLAAAAEHANVLAEQRLRHDYPAIDDRPRRRVEISAPSVEDWQQRVDELRAQREAGL